MTGFFCDDCGDFVECALDDLADREACVDCGAMSCDTCQRRCERCDEVICRRCRGRPCGASDRPHEGSWE